MAGMEVSIVVAIETKGIGPKGERIDELNPFRSILLGAGGKADRFIDFIEHTLKPYIDAKFRTKPDRNNTGFIGCSIGAMFGIYAALKNQWMFSKVGAFSPLFIRSEERRVGKECR